MEEKILDKRTKFLLVIVAMLIALVLFQTVYIGLTYRQNTANTAHAAAITTAPGNSWKLNTSPGAVSGNTSIIAPPVAIDPNTWDPFKKMEQMQQQMNQLFEQAFGRSNQNSAGGGISNNFVFNPNTDITDDGKNYVVQIDTPGVDSSRINITIEDRTLNISGTREESINSGQGTAIGKERRFGQFERVITLPGPVKQDGMKADYKNGVLTVTIKKDDTPRTKGVIR